MSLNRNTATGFWMRTLFVLVVIMLPLISYSGTVLSQVPDGIIAVVQSPDRTRLAVAGTNGLLKIVNAATNADLFVFPVVAGSVLDVAWSPDGSRIVSAHPRDNAIYIWDTQTYSQLSRITLNYVGSQGVAWSANGIYIAAYVNHDDRGEVFIFNAATQALVCNPQFNNSVFDLAWNPSNNHLAVANFGGVTNFVPSLNPSTCLRIPVENLARSASDSIHTITYNSNGSTVALGNAVGLVTLRNPNTWQILKSYQLQTTYISSLEFHPNGRYLVSVGEERRIRVIDYSNDNVNVEDYSYSQAAGIAATAFSPDGTRILFGDGTVIRNEAAFPPPPTATPTRTPTPTPTATAIPTGTINASVALEGRSTVPPMDTITGKNCIYSPTGANHHEMVLDIHKGSQKHTMGLSSVGA